MMKTSELTGVALDWAVAKCEGIGLGPKGSVVYYHKGDPAMWHPSTNWAQGGPIIEREMIRLTPKCTLNPLHRWVAAYRSFDDDDDFYVLHRKRGKTPLHAAMRCYVASKMGDTVEVPEELL